MERRQPGAAADFVRLFCPKAKLATPIRIAGEVIALSDSEDDISQDLADVASTTESCQQEELDPHMHPEALESRPGDVDEISCLDEFAFDGPLAEPKPLYVPANRNVAVSEEHITAPAVQHPSKRQQRAESPARKKKRIEASEDFETMTTEEREQIRRKWWNFAEDAYDIEGAKMQLLIAAILHAKASEIVVQKSLQKLRAWAQNEEDARGCDARRLTAKRLATASVADLELHLEGVHWHKTKASRIVAAAKVILKLYDGQVPLDRDALLTVPGIGPKLANVLNFVLGEGRVSEGHDNFAKSTIAKNCSHLERIESESRSVGHDDEYEFDTHQDGTSGCEKVCNMINTSTRN